ncbi:MAG: metallophosphoesterase [Anaerolineales bacterium]|nr:metallophosphoesterase [Anaerolineales bacterium]
MLKIGVIADTHVPDRTNRVHPEAIELFKHSNVHAILHAGDITLPKILKQLEGIAPVYAVKGNRDLFGFRNLPLSQTLQFEDIKIGLTHGHINWAKYLENKIKSLLTGPLSFSVAQNASIAHLPSDVNVVVFGHNHQVVNKVINGKLIFNPGSAACPIYTKDLPSVGLLTIDRNIVKGEIYYLSKFSVRKLVYLNLLAKLHHVNIDRKSDPDI